MTKKYYFIGIGGISMSSLAVFLKLNGNEIAGSDIGQSKQLNELSNFNIPFYRKHLEKNISDFNPDYVIINFAISPTNEEYIWAIKNKKKIINRADLLAKISKKFKNVIAISGTHGKTTTTALISEIFIDAGLKPTIHIGGILKKNNSNFLIGDKKYFITEACEYKNSFLSLKPQFSVTLNIESDHMDFFKNIEIIKNSFKKFQKKSKINLIYQEDNKFSLDSPTQKCIYSAVNVKRNAKGYNFDFLKDNKKIANFQTNFFGEYNIKNALGAISVAIHYKIPIKSIKKSIKNFHGVKRRFEKIGKLNKALVIHDYAHHPTAIQKVIKEAVHYGKVLTVFQPHTYSRTKALYNSFINCFNSSSGLILVKTYPARESENMGKSAYDLYKSIKNNLNNFNYLDYAENFETAKKKITQNVNKYNCVLILGAGDVDFLVNNIFKS